MTTVRTAGVLAPTRPVSHLFELRGWVTGVGGLDEIAVRIAGEEANLTAEPCPGAPPGAVGFRALPATWAPSGVHRMVVEGPDGEVLTGCALTVGTLPGEPPLWLGELEAPTAERASIGHVVLVCGWALLDSRAPSLVEVHVEGGGTVRARTRLPRKDVPKEFPAFADAAISGFEARVPIDLPPGEERTLSLWVRYRTEGVGEHVSPKRTFVLRHPPADPEDAELAEELAEDTARALARVEVRTDPRHVLVLTHSLGVGGGQLWLQELLGRLVTEHGWRASLVSETDGPLRADCAELGIPVHVTTHYRHSSVPAYEGHVGELARFAKCSGAGVALVNTLGGFVAADAAKRAGLPTAWVIHESFTLPDFAHQNWGPEIPPAAVWSRWHSTLAEVDLLLFVADATREMFLPYSKPERCRTVRYGTPMWKFGGRTRPEIRRQVRNLMGFSPDDVVLVNIGVAESRKGQGPLISAMERIHRAHPEARLDIVGLHPSPYGLALEQTVRRAGLQDVIRLIPIQRDPTPWLQAADLFVNSSDIESLPRSILEAVCCGVPVAATDVFGAREMITDGETGWLFETNDVDALAAALLRALETPPARRREMARAAHAALSGWLDPAGYAREYAQILTDLADHGGSR
ncbi:MAG TPA: glycosyltransferase [Actinophytocola sp.]|uniref:glycosyltransferase n=1 Tax=Actinophytocola sp. TaxID=1872138 RepID=UPI002DDCC234|nr:glycosyltransferase [Actinophytocola sp.]HEV2780591.1 glycosyltransferase [Actinophytocola sp.]